MTGKAEGSVWGDGVFGVIAVCTARDWGLGDEAVAAVLTRARTQPLPPPRAAVQPRGERGGLPQPRPEWREPARPSWRP